MRPTAETVKGKIQHLVAPPPNHNNTLSYRGLAGSRLPGPVIGRSGGPRPERDPPRVAVGEPPAVDGVFAGHVRRERDLGAVGGVHGVVVERRPVDEHLFRPRGDVLLDELARVAMAPAADVENALAAGMEARLAGAGERLVE